MSALAITALAVWVAGYLATFASACLYGDADGQVIAFLIGLLLWPLVLIAIMADRPHRPSRRARRALADAEAKLAAARALRERERLLGLAEWDGPTTEEAA